MPEAPEPEAPDVPLEDVLLSPEQPFCFHCGSLGFIFRQSVPAPALALFALRDPVVEPDELVLSFAAIVVWLPRLEVLSREDEEPDVLPLVPLDFEDFDDFAEPLVLPEAPIEELEPLVPEADAPFVPDVEPLPLSEPLVPELLPRDEPELPIEEPLLPVDEPLEPALFAVPLPSPPPLPVLPNVVPAEPVLFAPLDCDDGVLPDDEPLPYVLPLLPVLPDMLLPLLLEPLLLLWVVVSVFGDFLFLFMSPRANAEPLASATMELKMNAGASLRIWASFYR